MRTKSRSITIPLSALAMIALAGCGGWESANVSPRYQPDDPPRQIAFRESRGPAHSIFGTSDGKSFWAVGDKILHSRDGEHWDEQPSPAQSRLNSVFGTSDGKSLWAVGDRGTIVHSRDGTHWATEASTTSQNLNSVSGSSDGMSLWAVGSGGTILHSPDGEHWALQTGPANVTLRSVFAPATGTSVWAVGAAGTILQSPDGEHWVAQARTKNPELSSVVGTSDGKSLWAVGGGGTILHTRDGEHWDSQTVANGIELGSISGTADGKSLWIAGGEGAILHSRDGEHWDSQKNPYFYGFQRHDSIFAASDGKSFFWADGYSIVAGNTDNPEPYLSSATVAGNALKLTLTCPGGSQAQGSIDVTAAGDEMLRKNADPKPVGTLQFGPSCKVGSLEFDAQSLNLASGDNVHFRILVHLNDVTQSYTVDGVYRPWLPFFAGSLSAGGAFLAALLLFMLRRVLGLAATGPKSAAEVSAPSVVVIANPPVTELAEPVPERVKKRKLEVTRVLLELDEEAIFRRNVNDIFLLRSLTLHKIRFFENGAYEFAPRVNVLLGKNGYGKTLLFRALAALIQGDKEHTTHLFPPLSGKTADEVIDAAEKPDAPTLTLRVDRNGESDETIRDTAGFREPTIGRIPLLAIPDSRFVNRKIVLARSTISTTDLTRDGARHFIAQEPFEGMVIDLLVKLCEEYNESKSLNGPIFTLIAAVVRELTDDDKFTFHSINKVGTGGYEILVTTAGNEGNPVTIQNASQGTLSVLVIFGVVFSFLKSLRPDIRDDAVFEVPGIVMIDEIDAHLHPSWQQKIMPILTKRFPKVQFIVSAHSPLLVAGCDRNEVAVLRRNPDSDRFAVEMLQQDFLGAKVQDLYQLVFEVGDMDHLYLEYSAKAAAGGQAKVAGQIERIENTRRPTPQQETELGELLRERRLMKKAAEVREARLEAVGSDAQIAALRNDVERLQNEIAKLRGQGMAK